MSEQVRQLRPPPPPPSVVEGKLLGALLALKGETRALLDVSGLTEDDLQDNRVRWAWRVAVQLLNRGDPVDADTVHAVGKGLGFFSDADAAWLDSLYAANVLTAQTFAVLAGTLRRGVLGRAIAARFEPMLRDLRQGNFNNALASAEFQTASEALARADSSRGTTAAGDVMEQEEAWKRRESGESKAPGILSRIKVLDEVTAPNGGLGGFPPKLCVIMGLPGIGKNMLLATMIRAQLEAEPDLRIGAFFLEDGSKWLIKRWTAFDLGIPVGNVGVVTRTPEQSARLHDELYPHYHRLLERVFCWRWRRIRPAEAIHECRVMIHQHGVREFVFDSFTHLDHRPAPFGANVPRSFIDNKRNEAVGEAVARFAELADVKEIPFVALAHTVRPTTPKERFRPPLLSEVADTSSIDKEVRFAAGLWRTVKNELRLTVQKNTEGPGSNPPTTIELVRHSEAAIIDPFLGRVVNIEQEEREERQAREADREADADARIERRRLKNEERKAKAKAEAEARKVAATPPAPQLELIAPAPNDGQGKP